MGKCLPASPIVPLLCGAWIWSAAGGGYSDNSLGSDRSNASEQAKQCDLGATRAREGWWFAIPRSSAAGDKNASQTPYKHRLAHASGSRPLAFRAGVPVRGFLGRSPKPFLGTFAGAKVPPRRQAYKPNPFVKLCDAVRREQTITIANRQHAIFTCSVKG